jgi:hypothetical protein
MNEPTEKKGKCFTLATPETHELCKQLIELYHPDMDSAAAKVDIVMAFRDPDGDAPAMEKDGHRILGLASTIKLKDRVKGMGDCEIMLDGDAWENLTDKHKAALMDHELEHLEVKRDKIGDFVMDDLIRPVIKLRNHDRQFGWFDNIARRHRSDSMEVQQMQKLFLEVGQTYLPFVKEFDVPAEQSEEPAKDEKFKVTMSANGGPEVDVTKAFKSKLKGGAK